MTALARVEMYASMTWMFVVASLLLSAGDASLDTQRAHAEFCETAKFANRDKSGTTAGAKTKKGSQVPEFQGAASLVSLRAEGMGLEPTTGFPASDFESDSSPFGYPPEPACLS